MSTPITSFSLAKRPPDQPPPHWSDNQVEAAVGYLDSPFNSRIALVAMARLALQLSSRFSEYELVVGEGESSRWSRDVFTLLVDASRRSRGLPGSHTEMIDGRDGEAYAVSDNRVYAHGGARALLLTEYVFTGGSIQAAYKCLSQFRPASSIDIATVGTSRKRPQSPNYSWLDPHSNFYFVTETQGTVDEALTGTKFRNAINPEVYAENTAMAAVALQSILNQAQTLTNAVSPDMAKLAS